MITFLYLAIFIQLIDISHPYSIRLLQQNISSKCNSTENLNYSLYDNDPRKIAFLFLTRGQMPLEEIWHEFFTWRSNPKYYSIYVHPHKDYSFPEDSFFHKKEVRSNVDKVKWGTMSQVRAIKSLVAEALKDPFNEWFCLMSESCIPLMVFPKWRYHLLSFNKSITNACPLDPKEAELETRWKPQLFNVGMKKEYWRKSGTWFALMRKHAELFVKETAMEVGWEDVPCCDEHYLPSTLAYYHQDNETSCSDGFVHVVWFSQISAHPLQHGPEEISKELFYHLRHPDVDKQGFGTRCSGVPGVCHFTARKFGYTSKFELLDHTDFILSEEGYPYTGNPWDHHKENLRYDRITSVNESNTEFYLLENNCRRLFPDNITAYYMHIDLNYATPLTDNEKYSYPIGMSVPSHKDGQTIRARKQFTIYYTKYGHRHPFPNGKTFLKMGFDFEAVHVLYEGDICRFPMGDPMPDLSNDSISFNLSSIL